MLSDMPFIYGRVAVGGVVPFLSVVAVVRRVFCRIKSPLKLFLKKNTIQGFFSLEKLSVVSHASCPRLARVLMVVAIMMVLNINRPRLMQ